MPEKKPEPIVHYRASCQTTRAFRVAHETTYRAIGPNEVPEELSLAFCPTCRLPGLFGRELYGVDEQGIEILSDHYRLYPAEERSVAYALPKLVKESYDEAVKCERSGTWIATVTMARRALEAIAKEYVRERGTATSGRSELFATLDKMHRDGAISDEMKQWADGLRTMGNMGAHANPGTIGRDDAKASLDFLQALMEIIYELRPRFAAWQKSPKPPLKPNTSSDSAIQ